MTRVSQPLSTLSIAVFMDWYEPRILRGIAQYAKEHGCSLIFDHAQAHRWTPVTNEVDGIIALIGPDPAAAKFLRKLNLPMVALTSSSQGLLSGVPEVLQDNVLCGRMAADYFHSLGFQNFLVIGKKSRTFFLERIQGFEERCRHHGHKTEVLWIQESLAQERFRRPIEVAIQKAPKPLAVFVPADITAVHVMRYALALGLKIPEELAILGADNETLICDYAPIPLSSIRLDFSRLGYEGASLLIDVMQNGPSFKPRAAIPPLEVIKRQSTDIVAVPDVRIAQALRFIWANLGRQIGIADIADQVGLSSTTLARLFRQHLQRSVVEEITRARIEKAKKQLKAGNLKAQEVAKECGFSSPNYFNNVFLTSVGLTPRKYQLANR